MEAAQAEGSDDDDMEEDEPFVLPSAEEREKEKSGAGPDVRDLQARMQACVRVLEKFKKLGAGRYAHLQVLCVRFLTPAFQVAK